MCIMYYIHWIGGKMQTVFEIQLGQSEIEEMKVLEEEDEGEIIER